MIFRDKDDQDADWKESVTKRKAFLPMAAFCITSKQLDTVAQLWLQPWHTGGSNRGTREFG